MFSNQFVKSVLNLTKTKYTNVFYQSTGMAHESNGSRIYSFSAGHLTKGTYCTNE